MNFLSTRFFSTTSRNPAIFAEMLATANGIKDHNFRDYFTRKVTYMQESRADMPTEDLLKEQAQLVRIQTVQNLYHSMDSVLDHKK